MHRNLTDKHEMFYVNNIQKTTAKPSLSFLDKEIEIKLNEYHLKTSVLVIILILVCCFVLVFFYICLMLYFKKSIRKIKTNIKSLQKQDSLNDITTSTPNSPAVEQRINLIDLNVNMPSAPPVPFDIFEEQQQHQIIQTILPMQNVSLHIPSQQLKNNTKKNEKNPAVNNDQEKNGTVEALRRSSRLLEKQS